MEAENQNASKSSETADDSADARPETDENPSEIINNSQSVDEGLLITQSEASTSTANDISGAEPAPERSGTKRNYRRRTGPSDDENSVDDAVLPGSLPPAVAEAANASQRRPSSDSDDVSLDELRVSDDNNANPRSSDSDTDDSSFSYGSPLSPLVRFGLGGRSDDDTDSNATSDEEIVDRSKQQTRDILSKEPPLHNSMTWPRLLMNRENGFFCKRNESRFANHRKVFERNFYGSLNAVQRLELMAKLDKDGHDGCVNCLGFSKSGLYLLSGSDDLRIILWNWYNKKPLTDVRSKHRKNIFQCKFYEEDGSNMKAVSASADGTISLHQFANNGGHTEKQVYNHAGAVHKIAVMENVVYTCGEDGLIIEFDFRTKVPNKMITVREKHRKIPLFSISGHPSEMRYAVSGRDQFVRVYDRRNQRAVLSRHCPTELLEKKTTIRYISCCAYNYNGTELLGSFNDDNIYLFDASNHSLGSYLHKYQGHCNSATIKGVNFFGPKSEYIVSGSDCSNIFFWHKESEAIVQWMRGDENGIVNVLEPHPIYPILATSGLDKDIKIWMPSNDEFMPKTEELEKCVLDNMKNQLEAGQTPTFSLDPAIIQLARRFFQRHQRDSSPSNRLSFDYSRSSDDDTSSS